MKAKSKPFIYRINDGKKCLTYMKFTEEGITLDMNEYPEFQSLKSIGEGNVVFDQDGAPVKKLILPKYVKEINENALLGVPADTVVWPDLCFTIPTYAFTNSQLTAIENIDNVRCIMPFAFATTHIHRFKVPDKVKELPYHCFAGTNLWTISNTEHLTKIGAGAFMDTALLSFEWPSGCPTIENSTFACCVEFTEIRNIQGVTSIEEEAFALSRLCSIDWPKNCHHIREKTFYECDGLCNITGLDTVFSIGNEAFFNCGIKEIDLSKGVCVEIGDKAFARSNLTTFKPSYYLENVSETAFDHTEADRSLC